MILCKKCLFRFGNINNYPYLCCMKKSPSHKFLFSDYLKRTSNTDFYWDILDIVRNYAELEALDNVFLNAFILSNDAYVCVKPSSSSIELILKGKVLFTRHDAIYSQFNLAISN